MGDNLCDLGLDKDFLDVLSKVQSIKNNKLDLKLIFLFFKDTVKRVKGVAIDRKKNILKSCVL